MGAGSGPGRAGSVSKGQRWESKQIVQIIAAKTNCADAAKLGSVCSILMWVADTIIIL